MKCLTTKLLDYHEQGVIGDEWVVSRLVEETTTRPTTEFVATLPTTITDLIQTKAAAPPDTEWIIFGGGDLNRWLAGLALWREYFDSLEEEQP